MTKIAITILADSNGSDDSLGRVFNALVLANDLKQRNQEFLIFFQGAGTRWVKTLHDKNHPAHNLFINVKSQIMGASEACSAVFGSKEDISNTDIKMLCEFNIENIGNATSLAKYVIDGYSIVTF